MDAGKGARSTDITYPHEMVRLNLFQGSYALLLEDIRNIVVEDIYGRHARGPKGEKIMKGFLAVAIL